MTPEYKSAKMKVKNIILNGRSITLLDDSDLIGGTKDRAMFDFLEGLSKKNNKIYFPASANGLGMVSASLAGNKLRKMGINIEINIYTQFFGESSSVLYSRELGSNVKVYNKPFSDIYKILENECKAAGGIEIKLGGDDNAFEKLLINSFSSINVIKNKNTSHIWLIYGSGTIYRAMSKVFNKCIYHLVVVGKSPREIRDQDKVYISEIKFYDKAKKEPPYKTELTYDGKLWDIITEQDVYTEYINVHTEYINIYIFNVGYLPKQRFKRFERCVPF
jgi:hypothetical protein